MSRRLLQLWLVPASMYLALLSGCAGQKPETLGNLRAQPEPESSAQVSDASHKDVRTEYEELLSVIDDENIKEQIRRRIADVYMLEGEQEQVQAEQPKSYYADAIKSYREVLEKYPNSPDNAETLYQLAKAYDMEGDQAEALSMLRELTTRHPAYKNIAEANFRKADILFNRGAYDESEKAYRAVTEHENSNFYLNAHYMLGWSQYKQIGFRDALENFVYVLNETLTPGLAFEDLSKPNKSLAEDTLHAISLSLDKLAGAAIIQDLPELRGQHYVWMVYDELGQYYLEKELYEASAASYRQFIEHYPNEDITPLLHRKMIETYASGSFPRQAFAEKETFVDAYGIYSGYADRRGGVAEPIRSTMHEYLDELARNHHSRGQALQTEIKELTADNQQSPRPEKLEELDADGLAALEKAAHFYQQSIDTFANDENLDEWLFFRAEALFAARRYEESVLDYERVAYQPQTDIAEAYGADAGYAAIVAHERHLARLQNGSPASEQWRAQTVDSMLRFAEKYLQDERSASVLTNAAEHMFSLEQYERALRVARGLIEDTPELRPAIRRIAYGTSAHALYKLERFDKAAEDYLAQRQLVQEDSQEYTQISERLASATYKYAETIIATDNKPAAVEELLTIKQLTPDSPVRIIAQYDAATLLLELRHWSRAIAELQDLSGHYPDHQLATEFPRKLAFAYEKNGDWKLAAEEYLRLSESDPEPERRQEALYLSATMHEKDDDTYAAIERFKDYAHAYPEPLAVNMEARYKLAEKYGQVKDMEKRLFWLQKLVDGHRNAGDQGTERSRWLAAWANTEYGDYFATEFRRHNLYPPLGQSLATKNEQLENATTRYQAAADSGIFEFVTMNTYKIAELYQRFAKELRESPRPAGLAAEEEDFYAEILDEQALPFDEMAMDLHYSNLERAWEGEFDSWIGQSFARMRQLNPRRFAKSELIVSYGNEIR